MRQQQHPDSRGTPDEEEKMFNQVSPIYEEWTDPYGPEGVLYLDIDMTSKFQEKTENRLLSKPIIVRGVPWRILALCRGGQRQTANQRSCRANALGFFLQCNNEETLAKRGMWRCYGTATLEVLSSNGGENMSKKIHHTFHNNEVDWGFTNFESFEHLLNPANGYIENDTLHLRCHFSADVPTGNGYYWDSKLHTGCIGLRNQGATCYMNSILQAFYFTTGFRKAVYQMEVGTEPTESNICLAMQRVFYELQMATEAVETNSLTRAFGWDKLDAFNQHDVQEFCRVLLDNLETKMKGTSQEQSIPTLFRGNMKSFIKCTEVNYESSRTESFYDVQLNVLGMESLERAFEEYTAIETLDGENKYDAGDFGLQRAEKGVKFVQLPPVLHVQLMRFQYIGVEQKVNERFTFPEKMDLVNCCELSDDLTTEDCLYSLHAVLVHSGEFHGGHYVTFINTNLHETVAKPEVRPRWCKFDDDVVSRTTVDDAISSNFGGERSMNTSAYMLIYVRNNAIPNVLAPIPDEDIPERVSRTFELERQQANRIKKKKEEESMCLELAVITPDIITGHHGFDLIDIAVFRNKVPRENVFKSMSILQLYRYIEKRIYSNDQRMDLDENDDFYGDQEDDEFKFVFKFRIWKMAESLSSDREPSKATTRFRPEQYLDPLSKDPVDKYFNSEMDSIYVELPGQNEELAPYRTNNANDEVLIFVKYYDATSGVFTVLGSLIIHNKHTVEKYRDDICKMAGLPAGTLLRYYEEISSHLVVPIDNSSEAEWRTVSEEGDGAILLVEQAEFYEPNRNAQTKMEEMYRTTYLEFIETCFNKKSDEEVHEPIVKKIRLDAKLNVVTEQLGRDLECDPKNLLVWTKLNNGRSEPCIEDYSQVITSRAVLGRNMHDPRIVKRYRTNFSLLPFPVSEMQRRVQMKIFSMNDKMEVDEMTIFPLKDGTVANVLEEAKRYFKFSPEGSGKLRLVQVGSTPNFNRVHLIYAENVLVSDIETKYLCRSRVEEIPVDEIECQPGEFFCPVVHFDRDPATRLFGTSFVIKVKNGELMNDVRDRLRRRLSEVSDAEFAKYKFALLSRDKLCRYIEFGESDKVNLQDMASHTTGNVPQVYIGIDHKSPTLHSNENAIRILN